MRKNIVKRMCLNAIATALAVVLYAIGPKFPIPFLFPAFLDIQFSMLPILIVTFMLGPIDGLIVTFARFGIKFLFGTTTFGVGEISDLILTCFVILGCFLINKILSKKETLTTGAKTGFRFLTIIVSWVIGSLVSNAFSIPLYCLIMGEDVIVGLIQKVDILPFVTKNNWVLVYFLLTVIPFNLLLSSVVGGVTLSVDRHLLRFYNRI